MPPSLEEDLSDGLKLTARNGGEQISLTREWFAKDLEGGTPVEVFSSAWNLPGIPAPGDYITITIAGRTRRVYPNDYELDPWPPNDAGVRVVYSEKNLSIGISEEFGVCTVSGGTSLRQIETEFDADNLQKPFLERTPISVSYDPNRDGAPGVLLVAGGGTTVLQGGSVPAFIPDSSVTFTRFERTYPGARQRNYAGKRNAVEYEGCPIGTLLMWSVTFQQIRGDLYSTSYTLVYDPYMFWNQVLRYTDPLTGYPPKLSKAQLAGQNGIKEIVTQPSITFQALKLKILGTNDPIQPGISPPGWD